MSQPVTLETRFREALRRLLPMRSAHARGRVTVIVGMHRSGTSFLTGSLQQAGLELGGHSSWNPHNTRGNRENQEIVDLHDAILRSRGFAWDNPPTGIVHWTPQERARAQSIIHSFRELPHWGFKDPRSLLLIEGWQALLPKLHFVGVFRHPVAVARSLRARGGMPAEQAFRLWQAYNSRLLKLHRRSPFPLLSFDDPPERLLANVDRVAASIGLHIRPEERFYSDELKHHKGEDIALPEAVAATLQTLHRITLRQEPWVCSPGFGDARVFRWSSSCTKWLIRPRGRFTR